MTRNRPCTPGIEDKEKTWTRILVEKPFGNDMEEAKKLDELLGGLFDESQIFRIDHYLAYLAKGVVDKILSLRFGQEENNQLLNYMIHQEKKSFKQKLLNLDFSRIMFKDQ